MAKRRRKTRTHVRDQDAAAAAAAAGARPPKSFVIRSGQVGSSVARLVRDVRQVMEPNTATRLRERSANRLKDFVNVAAQLGVTHFLMFSRTDAGTNLRIARAPRGPTVVFRVCSYSLARDVLGAQRKPKSPGSEFHFAPLVRASRVRCCCGEEEEGETTKRKATGSPILRWREKGTSEPLAQGATYLVRL
ncbi:MAG: Brix domain-containing protein [Olpidium bornovanus]|uniref:Brix domain-containing protein n=1 Tax=Olpidium bornovanus TaxID=278681 RepID=A0A8H7ZXE5_9FUNG|nr:MAG: Brix domain-containing protein [Olpidium bornovanus]